MLDARIRRGVNPITRRRSVVLKLNATTNIRIRNYMLTSPENTNLALSRSRSIITFLYIPVPIDTYAKVLWNPHHCVLACLLSEIHPVLASSSPQRGLSISGKKRNQICKYLTADSAQMLQQLNPQLLVPLVLACGASL